MQILYWSSIETCSPFAFQISLYGTILSQLQYGVSVNQNWSTLDAGQSSQLLINITRAAESECSLLVSSNNNKHTLVAACCASRAMFTCWAVCSVLVLDTLYDTLQACGNCSMTHKSTHMYTENTRWRQMPNKEIGIEPLLQCSFAICEL